MLAPYLALVAVTFILCLIIHIPTAVGADVSHRHSSGEPRLLGRAAVRASVADAVLGVFFRHKSYLVKGQPIALTKSRASCSVGKASNQNSSSADTAHCHSPVSFVWMILTGWPSLRIISPKRCGESMRIRSIHCSRVILSDIFD